MAIQKKWVHNKYWDVTGTTAGVGSVRFALTLWTDDPIDNETFAPGSFSTDLDVNGAFSVQLRINNDPNENPNNTAWTITETVNGQTRTRTVQILSTNPRGNSALDPIELDDLAPVVASPVFGSYVPAALFDLLESRVEDLEAGGGGGPGGGNVATDTIWDNPGDTVYASGANAGVKLGIGNAGQFYKVNTSANAPQWVDLADADIPSTIARDSEVTAASTALVGGAPTALNTLGKVATALGNDAAFATTNTTALAGKVAIAGSTSTGQQVAPSFQASGKTGATATPITIAGGTATGAPTTGAHVKGELVWDDAGKGWYCTVAGSPGTWKAVTDPSILGTGTRTGSKVLFDDGTWQLPPSGGGSVTGAVTGVINPTDAAYGMVNDGVRVTNAALTSGASPVLTSASNPFVAGDVGKVVQLYREAYIMDAAITSGSAVLTSATGQVPTWVQPGMVVHVGGAGNTGQAGGPDTLITTVLSNDGTGQITLAANAFATVAGSVTAPKPTLIYGLFQSTVATYTNAGSVTLAGTAPYSFTAGTAASPSTAVWGTDNRVAFAAATAAAVAQNRKMVTPGGIYVILVNQANPNAMGLLSEGILSLSGADRSLTEFAVITDGVQTVETNLIQRSTNLDIDLADFKISYHGPQFTALSGAQFVAIHPTGRIGDTRERWVRAYRVDLDPTYRPIEGLNNGAGSGYANQRMVLEDCRFHCVSSGAMSFFGNGIRSVTTGATTNLSATVTSANFNLTVNDLGKRITGTNIPPESYIGVINSTTSLGLSSQPNVNIPVGASGTGSSLTLNIEGVEGRLYANRCRFDTSQQLLTRIGDIEMNAHGVYVHPFMSFDVQDCTFSMRTRTAGAWHWHGNGGANGYPKFNKFTNCSFEGYGQGVWFSGGSGITQVTMTNCRWSGNSNIGTFRDATDLIGCTASGNIINGALFNAGTGSVSRVVGGSYSSSKSSNFVPFTLQAASAGAKLIIEDTNITMGTNWASIASLSGVFQQDLVIKDCTLVAPASNVSFFVFPQNAASVFFRNNICSGTLINAPIYCASSTWTGRAVVEGNDFSGMSVAAAVQDNQTTGTNSNVTIFPTNRFGSVISYRSAGRSGAKFTATQGHNATAVTSTSTLLLLPDSDANSYVLNPGSGYTLQGVCRHTQASRIPTDETIWLTNSSANTITLATGTGHGAITTVGTDTVFDAGKLLMLRGNGAGGWHARIVP